jgi:hypothetical protein
MIGEFVARRAAGRSDGARPPVLRGRYGLLLLLLITNYLLSAFSVIAVAEPLQVALFGVVLVLALRNSPLDRREVRLAAWATAIAKLTASNAAMWHLGLSPFFESGRSATPQRFQYSRGQGRQELVPV